MRTPTTPDPDMFALYPETVIVLVVAGLLVAAAVWLWMLGTRDDERQAAWARQDAIDAAETREYIATMRDRKHGTKLDGTAADTGSMRKATL